VYEGVILKSMNHFVAKYVVGLPPSFGEGKNHPVFKGLGYPAGTNANCTRNGCSLLKISMVVVD